ncbi:MAG: class I SAM-dependent methyltransferase [Myxococcales bacterium]|nr:class I SAM-dependent methyltransferase [Myxococcales bacterium]
MIESEQESGDPAAIQAAQEDEYRFPYHYVTSFSPEPFRQHFVDTWGINYASTIELVVDRVQAGAPASLIDIGCGDGRLTREIGRRTNIPKICGVDTSARAIALAQAMNRDLPLIEFTRADITERPPLGRFDAAVLMEVFEHIPPDRGQHFLSGARALLNDGGRLHVTVPHSNKPVEYKHFRHFTVASITACLERDFEIVEVLPFERRGALRKLLDTALCNRLFVLNNQRLLEALYRLHRRHLFECDSEADCQRLYVQAVAR